MKSPLQSIIDKMFFRINEKNVTTDKLSQILLIAFEMRDGLLNTEIITPPENIEWVNKSILDLTEIMVRSNHKAHRILNGNIVPGSCEDEVKEELDKISKQLY